jgi:hypothetical protein
VKDRVVVPDTKARLESSSGLFPDFSRVTGNSSVIR